MMAAARFAGKPHAARRAFSLVELVVVILIIGILGAVAIPRVSGTLHRQRVEHAGSRLAADLDQLRRSARTSGQTLNVRFNKSANTYTVPELKHPDHPTQPYLVRLAEPPYQVRLFSVDFGGDPNMIFDGYGVPDSNGLVVLESGGYRSTVEFDRYGKARRK